MPLVCKILLVYLAGISLVAVVVTIADKSRARRHKWRVPEATLLTLSALGGSAAMYVTMRCIRHKPRRKSSCGAFPPSFFCSWPPPFSASSPSFEKGSPMFVCTAEAITKAYGEKPLLGGVSLTVAEGEKVGLIGVNGTGKSTLLENPGRGGIPRQRLRHVRQRRARRLSAAESGFSLRRHNPGAGAACRRRHP